MFLSSVRSESNSVKAFIFFMFLTTSSISSIVYYSLALFNSSLWRIQIIMNKPIHNLISVSQTKGKKYTIQCQNEIQEEIKTYRQSNKQENTPMNEWMNFENILPAGHWAAPVLPPTLTCSVSVRCTWGRWWTTAPCRTRPSRVLMQGWRSAEETCWRWWTSPTDSGGRPRSCRVRFPALVWFPLPAPWRGDGHSPQHLMVKLYSLDTFLVDWLIFVFEDRTCNPKDPKDNMLKW